MAVEGVEAVSVSDKLYSSDKVLYAGMKADEANTNLQTLQIFKQADTDGDGKISLIELASKDDLVINDRDSEFYPGLKLKDIKEKDWTTFLRIDKDKNAELSQSEVQEVMDIKKVLEAQLPKYRSSKAECASTCIMGGFCLAALGLLATAGSLSAGLLLGGMGILLAGGALYFGWPVFKEQNNALKNMEEATKDNQYGKQMLDDIKYKNSFSVGEG